MWSALAATTTSRRLVVSNVRLLRPTTSAWRFYSITTRQSDNDSTTAATAQQVYADGGVFGKIACIGTGKMAQAILHPLIHQGVQPANQFMVFDAQPKTMQRMNETYGVQTANSIPECVADADLVLCAVKPQNLNDQFFAECRKGNPSENSIFLSVIAGKPSEIYHQGGFSKIVRSMPNTPATIGKLFLCFLFPACFCPRVFLVVRCRHSTRLHLLALSCTC